MNPTSMSSIYITYGKPYRLVRRAGDWQPETGSICYRQTVYDYGLANDDTRMTGVQHLSMTLDLEGGYPGFTVPVADLEPVEVQQ